MMPITWILFHFEHIVQGEYLMHFIQCKLNHSRDLRVTINNENLCGV